MHSIKIINPRQHLCFLIFGIALALLSLSGTAFAQNNFGNSEGGAGPNNSNTDVVQAPKTVYNRTLKPNDPGIYVKLKDWYCTSISFKDHFKKLIDTIIGDINHKGSPPSPTQMADFRDFATDLEDKKAEMDKVSRPEYFDPLPGNFQQSIHKTCYTKAELDKIGKFAKDMEKYLADEGYMTGQPYDPTGEVLLKLRRTLYGIQ